MGFDELIGEADEFGRSLVIEAGDFFDVLVEDGEFVGRGDETGEEAIGFEGIFFDEAEMLFGDKLEVAVFLAGDMGDGKKRGVGSDGFKESVGAGFADDQVGGLDVAVELVCEGQGVDVRGGFGVMSEEFFKGADGFFEHAVVAETKDDLDWTRRLDESRRDFGDEVGAFGAASDEDGEDVGGEMEVFSELGFVGNGSELVSDKPASDGEFVGGDAEFLGAAFGGLVDEKIAGNGGGEFDGMESDWVGDSI